MKVASLINELAELSPTIGKWTIEGSFKNNADKTVDGWESYKVADEGQAIVCDTEIRTLVSARVVDVYKHTMKIVFDRDKNQIIADGEWVFSLVDNLWIIENNRHRYTADVDESKQTISGKWENKNASGEWIYWYDKVLRRTK